MFQQYRTHCPAKLNLFLHITGKASSGYHLVDGLIMFADDLHDELTITESKHSEIIVTGEWKHLLAGKNILEKTFEALKPYLGNRLDKFKILLAKHIPIGAGLGGGSSNAGALLKFLIDKFQLNLTDQKKTQLGASIGADVPMFYHGRALYMSGIGEVIETTSIPPIWATITYPNIHIASKDIYAKGFKQFTASKMPRESFKDTDSLFNYLRNTSNDLFENALSVAPILQSIINVIAEMPNCKLARMSGSGSACFGLFDNPKDAQIALGALQRKFPGYRTYFSRLR